MNTVSILRQFIERCGVRHIFGIPGYANSPFLLQTLETAEIDVVLTKHEGSAAWMAYGNAIASGRFGVCSGTSGAGTTNLVSGLASAFYNSIPVLVITGQVETQKFGKGAFQELSGQGSRSVSAVGLLESMCKLNVMIESPEHLTDLLPTIYSSLTSGRPGPVHLNIPVNVQKQTFRGPLKDFEFQRKPAPEIPSHQICEAIDLLSKANAPLVLFGRGCIKSRSLATEFVSTLRLPFCTSIQAKGMIPTNTAGYFGVAGIAGSPRCNRYIEDDCDLLVVAGSSLNEFTTNGFSENFARQKKLIHIDIDPLELDKNYSADLSINADVETFFNCILRNSSDLNAKQQELAHIQEDRVRKYMHLPLAVPVDRIHDDARIAPMDIMATLEAHCASDTLFVADSGNNAVWAVHYLQTKPDQDFIIDINTGCMASGVVSAIGAKLAQPTRPVVCICGDGGFLMNGIEITTAADYDISVLWVVLNDHKLGMVAQGDSAKYGATVATEFTNCDIASMARAFGAKSEVVQTREQLTSALKRQSGTKGPVVLDVRFNDAYLPSVYARTKKTQEDRKFTLNVQENNT